MPFLTAVIYTPFTHSLTASGPKSFINLCAIFSAVGYLNFIMADERKNPEFLGGGPKFNTVGKDVRGKDEVIVPASQAGAWLRIALIGFIVLVLAGTLFYLNDQSLGRTNIPSGRGGQGINPDERPTAPTDPNLK